MNVQATLREKMRSGTLHMTLLDPNKQAPDMAAKITGEACELGTDAIMVGDPPASPRSDATTSPSRSTFPIYPRGACHIARSDAIYFMSADPPRRETTR